MLTKIVWSGKIDFEEEEHPDQAAQMTRDDNVLLNDVYFTSYNMSHQPRTPLTPVSKLVSVQPIPARLSLRNSNPSICAANPVTTPATDDATAVAYMQNSSNVVQ